MKIKGVFCIGIFLWIFFSAYTSYAENPYIFAAGMKLTIGMDRDFVLNTLRKEYKVEKNKFQEFGDDAWLVHDLKTNEVIAQASFENGSLKWAAHNWRTFYENDKSFSMAKSLFALISNTTKSESKLASVSSKTSRGSEFTFEEIEFLFENKKVAISIIQGDKQQTVQIDESIFK